MEEGEPERSREEHQFAALMTDVVIKWGEWPWQLVVEVHLDGEIQRGVNTVNLTQGTVYRGYRGELLTGRQQKLDSGYVWDPDADDFVMETVKGDVYVIWRDLDKAREWLAKHGS